MIRRKRILVFAGYFYPHFGGSEQNIYELLKRVVKKGYEVDIITCNTENVSIYEEMGGVHIYRLPSWDIFGATYPVPKPIVTTIKILWKLLRKKHDVINTQTRFMTTALVGLVFAKIKRIPLVHTERGSKHSVISNRIVDLISKAYDHIIGSLIVKSACKNIGISNATSGFLMHLGAKEPITIYNGIDTNLFRKKDNNMLRGKLMLNDAMIITFVGRLIYAKGVHDLISVFADIEKVFYNSKLLIVGYGPYKQELEKMAEKTCKEKILFLGRKKREEIVDILSITDIFVNPSYSEGLPTSVMEACAVGCAVVATDVGGTNEIIQDGETGFLSHPKNLEELKNKINILGNNIDLRKELGCKAEEYVKKNFSWDEIVEKWLKEIEMVISERDCKERYLSKDND